MDRWEDTVTVDRQIEAWQQELISSEGEITRIRARQVELIRHLDRFQVDTAQGARTMGDWTSAQLDLSRQTASRLTQIAHTQDPQIDQAMKTGRWGLDRAAALVKLRHTDITEDLFQEAATNYSLGRLYGLLDRLRRLDPTDEAEGFAGRFLVIQPNLDESVYQLWGRLPGGDGRIVEKALHQQETRQPVLPDQNQGQRRADALTTLCMDSLTGSTETAEAGRAVTVAEIFLDGHHTATSFGEQGASVASGPRVGPNTLTEILCTGRIRVILTDGLRPVASTDMGEAIPPVIRSYVRWRDQGNVPSKGATAATGSNPTTSNQEPMAGIMIPKT